MTLLLVLCIKKLKYLSCILHITVLIGGSSYTTGPSRNAQTQGGVSGFNADPFTGSSSYSTSGSTTSNSFFPQTSYKLFETGDPQIILNKLKEFNQKSGDGTGSFPEDYLEEVIKLCSVNGCRIESFDVLSKLLEWPDGNKNCTSAVQIYAVVKLCV